MKESENTPSTRNTRFTATVNNRDLAIIDAFCHVYGQNRSSLIYDVLNDAAMNLLVNLPDAYKTAFAERADLIFNQLAEKNGDSLYEGESHYFQTIMSKEIK